MNHTPLDINKLVDRYVERRVRSFVVGWVVCILVTSLIHATCL